MKSILMMLWGRRHRDASVARTEDEAVQARTEAEAALHEAQSKTPYYETLSAELRTLRERNHFADNIRATVRRA